MYWLDLPFSSNHLTLNVHFKKAIYELRAPLIPTEPSNKEKKMCLLLRNKSECTCKVIVCMIETPEVMPPNVPSVPIVDISLHPAVRVYAMLKSYRYGILLLECMSPVLEGYTGADLKSFMIFDHLRYLTLSKLQIDGSD